MQMWRRRVAASNAGGQPPLQQLSLPRLPIRLSTLLPAMTQRNSSQQYQQVPVHQQ
jgi:hypothetical protein